MQLALFDPPTPSARPVATAHGRDDDTENLLAAFREVRLAEGAHDRSVRREVGQLRALLREAEAAGKAVTLRALVTDLDLIAQLLREPLSMISRSTGRDRLRAVQRLTRIIGPTLGRDRLRTLSRSMPGCPHGDWPPGTPPAPSWLAHSGSDGDEVRRWMVRIFDASSTPPAPWEAG